MAISIVDRIPKDLDNLRIGAVTVVSGAFRLFRGRNSDATSASIETEEAKSATATFGAVAVLTTATALISAANANRKSIIFVNVGPNVVYMAPANTVTTTNGFYLATGASFTDERTTLQWWGIVATGETASVRFIEVA